MPTDIQTLIKQRPHLTEPLQLYDKWCQFREEAAKRIPKDRSALTVNEHKSYPLAMSGELFQLFLTIFDLPEDELSPLGKALVNGEVDFMRLPLGEVVQLAETSYPDEELARILFLFARPYFQALRESFSLDGGYWENGHCPMCSAPAVLASIVEGPSRRLHCSICGTTGTYRFLGCPNCDNQDSSTLSTIESEDEPGFRVVTCDNCRTYTKVLEPSVLKELGADLADIASLPLDIVVQEKGFSRVAPNPISLKKMS